MAINQLTFEDWNTFDIPNNEGFTNSTMYTTASEAEKKRKQLQSQHSQIKYYLNNTVKDAIDTLQAKTLTSNDSSIGITVSGNNIDLSVQTSAEGFATKNYVDTYKEAKSNKVTTINDSSTDEQYPSAKCVYDELTDKQETLVSGTNIKTVGGTSLLGSGDVKPFPTPDYESVLWSVIATNTLTEYTMNYEGYFCLNHYSTVCSEITECYIKKNGSSNFVGISVGNGASIPVKVGDVIKARSNLSSDKYFKIYGIRW